MSHNIDGRISGQGPTFWQERLPSHRESITIYFCQNFLKNILPVVCFNYFICVGHGWGALLDQPKNRPHNKCNTEK